MSRARWRVVVAAGFALALAAVRPAGAQGTVSGRIPSGANIPLADARVIVVGGTQSAVTSEDGKFTLRGVPAGSVDLQALHVGFQSQKRTVTVTTGQATTADFTMKQAVVQLDEVV